MKRRGVLGFLAGGVVAAPVMAKEAISTGLGMKFPVGGGGAVAGYASQGMVTASSLMPKDDYDPTKWMLDEIAGLMNPFSSTNVEMADNYSVNAFDADLACMRSISLVNKMRIQRERDLVRYRDKRIRSLKNMIADHIKRSALG